MLKIQTLLIGMVLVFVAAACANPTPPTTPTADLSPAPTFTVEPLSSPPISRTPVVALPADWQSYRDSELGFSLTHPREWEICTTTEHSRLFCDTNNQSGGPSFPLYYVTRTPPNFTNQDASAYNFVTPATIQAFANLKVGASLTSGEPNPEFSTFTRLPDATVNGETALVVENARVWEGGAKTKDRRVFVRHGDDWYMIGTYYESPAELARFEDVLATFRFEN